MGDNIPPPPPSSPAFTIPFLYYGLAVITTAMLVLVMYNLIIKHCCVYCVLTRQPERTVQNSVPSSSRSFDNPNTRLISSFKYKGEKEVGRGDDEGEYECPICLSVFEEGEEVRQMPRCKHFFHAPCIDMWLYSHVNCPVCRASLESPILRRNSATSQADNFQGRLVFTNMV